MDNSKVDIYRTYVHHECGFVSAVCHDGVIGHIHSFKVFKNL